MTATAPSHARTVWALLGVVTFMGGLAFASVPLYNLFCRITGFGGTTTVSEAGSDVILDETILVRFDASLASGMAWEFEAPDATEIRIGETAIAYYTATNPTDRTIAGTASYNVTPFIAGGYFSKIACFCFTEQVLEPGESVEMAVTFFVDPAIVDDAEASQIPAITLSYTFYEMDLPEEEYAALDAATD